MKSLVATMELHNTFAGSSWLCYYLCLNLKNSFVPLMLDALVVFEWFPDIDYKSLIFRDFHETHVS